MRCSHLHRSEKDYDAKGIMRKALDLLGFAREFLRSPRNTGAICPSSSALAQRMAAMVPDGPGKVIELGPGSGPMTNALLCRGVRPEDLILVERSRHFADKLRQRFPTVQIIHGDACELADLLGNSKEPIRAIVSSLPLRSLPRDTVEAIREQIARISGPGTRVIQFTYHIHDLRDPSEPPFSLAQRSVVWRNFPPARVDAFDWPRQGSDAVETADTLG